jgi:hypothetical protein
VPAWLTEDEVPAPVEPITCKDPRCDQLPGRYSRKWCDDHALPQLHEEARKVAEILRLAYSPDDPAMRLALERCVTSYHEPEAAQDVLSLVLAGLTPGSPPSEAELFELICKVQEAYEARRRDVGASNASLRAREVRTRHLSGEGTAMIRKTPSHVRPVCPDCGTPAVLHPMTDENGDEALSLS